MESLAEYVIFVLKKNKIGIYTVYVFPELYFSSLELILFRTIWTFSIF